jgi:hypothetical protein
MHTLFQIFPGFLPGPYRHKREAGGRAGREGDTDHNENFKFIIQRPASAGTG